MENEILLDTNALLRYILNDIEEQNIIVNEVINTESCYTIPSVIQEFVYVLENYYDTPRDLVKEAFSIINGIMYIEDKDLCAKAFDYYTETPKLDYVDCLLCAFKALTNSTVLTFDEKLKKKLENI